VRDDCESFETSDSAVNAIMLLRITRVFRIIWILKNLNILSSNTIINKLMV
jgi:hypothetical protein